MPIRRLAPLALALVLCTGAAAEEAEKSCVDQIAELCPDTEPNSPGRRACVKEKRDKLSAECQRRLGPPGPLPTAPPSGAAAELQQLRPFLEACGGDRDKIVERCPGKTGDPLLQCIVQHKSEMSQKCVDLAQKGAKPAQGAPPPPAK